MNLESFTGQLPSKFSHIFTRLFKSGATLTNDIIGDVTGDVTGDITGDVIDADGYIAYSTGSAIPTAATAGYSVGSIFLLEGAVLGQSANWINQGTAASCLFVPFGPVNGYGCAFAGGPVDLEDAADETTVALPGVIQADDICFASHLITAAADQFKTVGPSAGKDSLLIDMAMGANPTDSMDAVYAGFRNKCTPEYDIFAAGERVCVDGDSAAVAITVAGVLATDLCFVTPLTTDDTDTINLVVPTANTITVTMSADPHTDEAHSWSYMVLRKRGTFAPSHYVAYAGSHVCVGGDTAETATVAGVLATDVVISQWSVSDDDDCFIEECAAAANSIVWQTTDNPGTGHTADYVVLRAY